MNKLGLQINYHKTSTLPKKKLGLQVRVILQPKHVRSGKLGLSTLLSAIITQLCKMCLQLGVYLRGGYITLICHGCYVFVFYSSVTFRV